MYSLACPDWHRTYYSVMWKSLIQSITKSDSKCGKYEQKYIYDPTLGTALTAQNSMKFPTSHWHHVKILYTKFHPNQPINKVSKGKGSCNRPGVAQRVPGILSSQIFMTFGKMVRSSASRTGRLYPQEMFLVLLFTRGWVNPRTMVQSEEISLKNPLTPLRIDPGTFQLVAQCLNHYATPGPK